MIIDPQQPEAAPGAQPAGGHGGRGAGRGRATDPVGTATPARAAGRPKKTAPADAAAARSLPRMRSSAPLDPDRRTESLPTDVVVPESTDEPRAAAEVLRGELLPPELSGGAYSPPNGVLDLIYRMWLSMSWSRTGQLAFLLIAAAMAFTGIGALAHVVIGTPTLWSAVGGGVTGVGATATAAALSRRGAQRRESGRSGKAREEPQGSG